MDRFRRQSDLVPADKLADMTIQVVGLGAVGRPVVENLVAIGCNKLTLVDFDTVDETNVVTQGYINAHIGRSKSEVMYEHVVNVLGKENIKDCYVVNRAWSRRYCGVAKAVFMCVDSIDTRRRIWEACRNEPLFWCDTRMLGLTIRVLSAWDDASNKKYGSTFHRSSETVTGRCTAGSAIWPARIAASLMVNQFVRFINGQPPSDTDILFSLAEYTIDTDVSVQGPEVAAIPVPAMEMNHDGREPGGTTRRRSGRNPARARRRNTAVTTTSSTTAGTPER